MSILLRRRPALATFKDPVNPLFFLSDYKALSLHIFWLDKIFEVASFYSLAAYNEPPVTVPLQAGDPLPAPDINIPRLDGCFMVLASCGIARTESW